ncbi:Single hybrid motif superfamily protein [Perilla frutescens var. hirtella]|uniref:Single hybrid motif superfamily protein n=1 Tax=Perilla frutescens var. hirtella TaxID=608512 RepID=A0AAD4JQ79_PERFH|nr:Single hybrid motif superfamily protein [Perilla frutescens var. hirtella]
MAFDVLSAHAPNPFEPVSLDKAADEGLNILQSPRVGYFRRSRTIKGKRAPLSCKEMSRHIEGGPGALATLNS